MSGDNVAADQSVLQIVILQEGALVGSEVFPQGSYKVGREVGNDLVLSDPRVSSRHATLAFKDGRIFVRDDNSANGTFVNGQRAAQVEIRTMDDLTIGPFTLKFRVLGKKKGADDRRGETVIAEEIEPPKPAGGFGASAVGSRSGPETGSSAMSWDALGGRDVPPPPGADDALTSPGQTEPHASGGGPHLKVVRGGGDDVQPATWGSIGLQGTTPSARRAQAAVAPMKKPAPQPVPPRSAKAPSKRLPTDKLPIIGDEAIHTAEVPVADDEVMKKAPSSTDAPILRARVFWGDAMVALRAFPPGARVVAGAGEGYDLPVYNFAFPGDKFVVAKPMRGGWVARVPKGANALVKRGGSWAEARGEGDGSGTATLVPMEIARPLRIVHGRMAIELCPEMVAAVPAAKLRASIEPSVGYPLGIALITVAVFILVMPYLQRDVPDFSPQKLEARRAVLMPPPKKEKAKKKEKEEAKVEKKEPEKKPPVETKPVKPDKAARVAIQSVKKVLAGSSVQSLLANIGKVGGPKGYGDKGMGYKLSPLIGKPPIAMAGMSFGHGLGGFGGPITKGLGELRGMGGGGGPGNLGVGGMGRGRVGGLVVQAPKGQAVVRGSMDREAIARVINEHIAEIRACYERALLKQPGLAGKLVIEWTIDLDGRVSEVKLKVSALPSPDATNCITGALKTWRFPKPTGGIVVVSYPFIFNSVGNF